MITVSRTTRDSGLTYQRQFDLRWCVEQNRKLIKSYNRSIAFGDREYPSILLTTGCTRGYTELDPPRRINKKKYLNKLFRGRERPLLLVDNCGPIEFSGYLTQR